MTGATGDRNPAANDNPGGRQLFALKRAGYYDANTNTF